MNIVLVGFKNSGKTSVGKLIAEQDNKLFIDTDRLIEIEYFKIYKKNLTVQEIYKTKSELYFRDLEKKVIKNLKLNSNSCSVIATGGGVVLDPENLWYLKKMGKIIYLYLSYKTLLQRAPVFINKHNLFAMYQQRKDIYKKLADIIINVENKVNSTIAQEILLYGK